MIQYNLFFIKFYLFFALLFWEVYIYRLTRLPSSSSSQFTFRLDQQNNIHTLFILIPIYPRARVISFTNAVKGSMTLNDAYAYFLMQKKKIKRNCKFLINAFFFSLRFFKLPCISSFLKL